CRLERLPARPEKSLVIEAGRHEGGKGVEERRAILFGRRQGVDRADDEIVLERFRRRAKVRRRPPRAGHVDDRVRLLGPGPPDSARPVIFEASADDADAIGEQRGSDAVALEAEIGLAVESERERSAAVDRPAHGQTKRAHEAGLANASLAMTALLAVSRVITKDSVQVRCSQISRLS